MGDLALERSRPVTGRPTVRQERCSQDPYENIEVDEARAVNCKRHGLSFNRVK